jgi:hypothetical protein
MAEFTQDPFSDLGISAFLFAPFNVQDVLDKMGNTDIYPDEIILRSGSEVTKSALANFVEEMATEASDRAVPRKSMCEFSDLDAFSIVLSSVSAPDVPLSIINLGLAAEETVLDVRIHLVFTDAEWRGEGLGHIMAHIASEVVDRALGLWEDMPGATGGMASEVNVTGNSVSQGGIRLIEEINARFQSDVKDAEMLPA